MSAKPLTLFACAGLLLGAATASQTARAAAPVTLVLFPRTLSNDDDLRALIDVRKKLRTDGAYAVITYDPNSAAVKRAAGETRHPEWLTDPMGNDAERLALTRALGAAFSIVIAKADGRGKMDVRVNEAAPAARTWSGYDEKADDADRFIRQQAAFALANRVSGLPAPVALAPDSPPVLPLPAPVSPPAPISTTSPVSPMPAPLAPAAVSVPAPVLPVPPAATVPNALPAPATVPTPAAVPPSAVPPSAVPLPAAAFPPSVPTVPIPAAVAAPTAPVPVPKPAPALPAPAPVVVPAAPIPAAPSRISAPFATPTTARPAPSPSVPVTPPAPVLNASVSPSPAAARAADAPPVRVLPVIPAPTAARRVPFAAPTPAPRLLPTVSVPSRLMPPAQAAPPVQVAAAPPRQSNSEQALIVPSPLPIPAPSRVVIAPAPSAALPPAPHSDEDLVSVRALLAQGDDALGAGNFVAAIASYRDAVNGAPLAMMPRLKLAQAYLQSDRRDKALGEAQRALSIAPNDPAVQQFLMQLDAQTGSSDGAVARFQAVAAQNPQDPAAHLELADALWNNGALTQAEDEYQTAQSLAGPHTPAAQQAAAHLARLYAAQSRYADSLAALKLAGAGGYALALGIVQSRADALRSSLDAGLDLMDAGKTTHEAFYKTARSAAVQAQALADFVVKVSPPSAFGVSHLHRVLATHLMAQQAAVLVNYVETSDASFSAQAALLEKEAVTEMLTAHAAEQKLGLWESQRAEARN